MKSRILILGAVMAMASAPAFAHAFLEHANPGAGAILPAAPRAVTLDFTEELEPAFSGATVTDAAGNRFGAKPTVKGSEITVPIPPLSAGTYRVNWHAVSVDTHRTEGAYSFTVKP